MKAKSRLIVCVLYLAAFLVMTVSLTGTFWPPIPTESMWVYAFFGYLLLTLFTAPFFSKPTDTITTSVAVIFLILMVDVKDFSGPREPLLFAILLSLSICILGLTSAVFSIALRKKDSSEQRSSLAKIFFQISDVIGRGELLFSLVFLVGVFSEYIIKKPGVLIYLVSFWVIVVILKPVENVFQIIFETRIKGTLSKSIGSVRAYENPRIVLVSLKEDIRTEFPKPLGVIESDNLIKTGVALSTAELEGERWLRILLNNPKTYKPETGILKSFPVEKSEPQSVFELPEALYNIMAKDPENDIFYRIANNDLVGFVAEGSTTNILKIELVEGGIDMYEGRFVEVNIQGENNLYQVIGGETRSEALEKKSTLGYITGIARKIGVWDEGKKTFKTTKWMPELYEPVYMIDEVEGCFKSECVGIIPGSDYGITFDYDLAITHNTAILGVLGCGKTYLAAELIERSIRAGIKVICIDITGQYKDLLSDFFEVEVDELSDKRVGVIISKSRNKVDQSKELGGNYRDFTRVINEDIKSFLDDEARKLRVYNPESYDVTFQDSRVFQGIAGFGTYTAVDTTAIICEQILKNMAKDTRRRASLCVCLDEAHSLIPEYRSISYEGENRSAMRIAKAVLQGRKYGVGYFIVAQRTANISKSVLNQCNTVFAFRSFDRTGMEFLENYFGKEYAEILPALPDRHAVAFGRGISAESPLIIQVNDRDDFLVTRLRFKYPETHDYYFAGKCYLP